MKKLSVLLFTLLVCLPTLAQTPAFRPFVVGKLGYLSQRGYDQFDPGVVVGVNYRSGRFSVTGIGAWAAVNNSKTKDGYNLGSNFSAMVRTYHGFSVGGGYAFGETSDAKKTIRGWHPYVLGSYDAKEWGRLKLTRHLGKDRRGQFEPWAVEYEKPITRHLSLVETVTVFSYHYPKPISPRQTGWESDTGLKVYLR